MFKHCSVHFQYRADCEFCKRANQVNAQISDDDDCLIGSLPTVIAGEIWTDPEPVSVPDSSPSFDSFSGGDSGGGGSSDNF